MRQTWMGREVRRKVGVEAGHPVFEEDVDISWRALETLLEGAGRRIKQADRGLSKPAVVVVHRQGYIPTVAPHADVFHVAIIGQRVERQVAFEGPLMALCGHPRREHVK